MVFYRLPVQPQEKFNYVYVSLELRERCSDYSSTVRKLITHV